MKKAILVVSFGTSHVESLYKTISRVENNIKQKFQDYVIVRAFTSHIIINKLKEKEEILVYTPEKALDVLLAAGISEVIIQPLHIIAGEEYDYVKKVYTMYKDKFKILKLSRPMLYFEGLEERNKDYTNFAIALKKILPKYDSYVLVGHGSFHIQGTSYGCLQNIFIDEGMHNYVVGTVEGYPSVSSVLKRLSILNKKTVLLVPMMLVYGDHAKHDIFGDGKESWKNILKENGYDVFEFNHGLGEFSEISDLYINHIDDEIHLKFEGLGITKKGGELHEIDSNFIEL